MERQYLIDTNTVIDYLDNKLPEAALQLIDNIKLNLSVVTRMELLAWPRATSLQLQSIQNFINACVVYGLDEPVIIKSIETRKLHRVKLPDAIIASTAIVHKHTLITRNTTDFKNVTELTVFNPWIE